MDPSENEWHDPTSVRIIPHSGLDAPDCCGCIFPLVQGDQADLICNECGAVLRRVPASEVEPALDELAKMAFGGEICSHSCPHCGALNTFPGFSAMFTYVCSSCGQGVAINERVQ